MQRKNVTNRIPLPLLARLHNLKKEGKIASINEVVVGAIKKFLYEHDYEHETFKPRK
jgi:hypothetical protein